MAKKAEIPTIPGADITAFRKKNGLNQAAFWSPFGVTQSGGSRYESGRKIPKPIQHLLVIAYGTSTQAQTVIDQLREGNSK